MGKTKKVLVAEDSSVVQNVTKRVLQFQNYEIASAKNGKQVLEKLEKEHFDVILMDINMPVMDGIECARRVRLLEDKAKASIPIIAITGNAANHTEEEFRAMGIDHLLQKPLNFDALVNLVKEYAD